MAPPHQPDSSNGEAEPEITSVEKVDMDASKELNVSDSQKGTGFGSVDSIVDEQISGFSTEVKHLLRVEHVNYTSHSTSQTSRNPPQIAMLPFSEYVLDFNTPFPVQSYVNSFRDGVSVLLDPRKNRQDSMTLISSSAPGVLPDTSSPVINPPVHSPSSDSVLKPVFTINSPSSKEDQQQQLHDMQIINGLTQAEQSAGIYERLESQQGETLNASTSSQMISDSGESMANSDIAAAIETAPADLSILIKQLQPEVINNLVKIMKDVQKNTVHFYIHSVDEESDVCWEIKV